ncbi:aminoglycoside phosphotransferase family protein [Streptomyces durbertensis]|uniref:Aminoglycoside phosphotransferase family protein n=1 Tax=Streptomyces durbertensis TaxID=2448886 RepID=A0ABR6EK89_9ACTN|nr:aminoglycoside phosphotransferase family protein [Streptomyces durbertensis]MBB1245754.1 aminoglycoside phosphotransferase family protein [Streptomyces durbertensis]
MPSDGPLAAGAEFTSERASAVSAEACRTVGLDPTGAKLIRFGENALFRLATHPVIVRVARSTEYLDSVQNEVAVSRWLADEGFPAARVLDDVEQPVVVDGSPVTFWHLIVPGDRNATYTDLGRVLRDLHGLTLPDGLKLPPYSAFGRTDLRVERVTGIPEADRAFLRERSRLLRTGLAELRFESAKGPVHGDAHIQNLMVDRKGRVVLIDFEAFSFDHPEWDLMVTATEHHSLGWQTTEQYSDFISAYGRDLGSWHGFATLRGIQEFRMTTWLMQNVGESRAVAEEYAHRIATLRNDSAPRHWQPA